MRRRIPLSLLSAGVAAALLTTGPSSLVSAAESSGTASPAVSDDANTTNEDAEVTVRAERASVPVDEGDTARVELTLETDRPSSEPVTVDYAPAEPGSASRETVASTRSGSITFPAGTENGTTRTITIETTKDHTPETARRVPIRLVSEAPDVHIADPRVQVVMNAHDLPYLDEDLAVQDRVEDLLDRMTLEEKVGQMAQAERAAVADDPGRVSDWMLGSLLSGGGSVPSPNTPEGWADMVDEYQDHAMSTRLQIPLIYGTDSVHGHNNVEGATIFPHNIGLGATGNPDLVEEVSHITAKETRATGPQWTFAPCLCVARDARWGRTYESFSEDPELATDLTTAIDGFQGPNAQSLADNDRVLATAKHYAGDGHTTYDEGAETPLDQGVAEVSREEFDRVNMPPFDQAVAQDVGSVMLSYSSVDWTDDGLGNPTKLHAHDELVSETLKDEMGFERFVVSDYEAIQQLPGDYADQVQASVNAGVDMFMEPHTADQFIDTLQQEVDRGGVSEERIDDAVRRILTAKFDLGLFEDPYTDRTHLEDVGSDEHRAVARQAVAESQVLLKNADGLLPLDNASNVYVAGENADDLGNQAGGWTLTWQGFSGSPAVPGDTILEGMRQVAPDAEISYSTDGSDPVGDADVGVVVVGETPYAEGYGDVGGPQWVDDGEPREPKRMTLQPEDQELIDQVCGQVDSCVVLVVSGRPQVIAPEQLEQIDGLVASWLPGSEGAGVADVLFGEEPFTGQLSHSWPRTADDEPINVGDDDYDPLFPYGWGLTTN